MNSVLTSLRSPHIGRVKALHTSKGRKTANEFLAEGPQAVEAAIKVTWVKLNFFSRALRKLSDKIFTWKCKHITLWRSTPPF
jgi:tRNA G18 (ribose-2'-O)-methylase SpoU